MSENIRLSAGDYAAEIAPHLGMALMTFTYRGIPLLDPGRFSHFDESRKGRGPIIFPHFNQAGPSPVLPEAQCQWVPGLRKLGIKNHLQHGVGRYADWRVEQMGSFVTGRLSSKDLFLGKPVKEWIGVEFEGALTYAFSPEGLRIRFEAKADKPIQAGIHYYYALVDRTKARVTLPSEKAHNPVLFDKGLDEAFPVIPGKSAVAVLETPTHRLMTAFASGGEKGFDAIILYSPENTAFCCIEPITWLSGMGVPRVSISSEILLSAEAV